MDSSQAVSERAAQLLNWVEAARMDILSIALDHLTLGRAALYAAILEGSPEPKDVGQEARGAYGRDRLATMVSQGLNDGRHSVESLPRA